MTGWNLPPGCTDADIDRAAQGGWDEQQDDDDCCHEEYHTDSEGACWCAYCSFHWYPTPQEIAADRERQQRYDRWCRQQERRERWLGWWDRMRRAWNVRKTASVKDDCPF